MALMEILKSFRMNELLSNISTKLFIKNIKLTGGKNKNDSLRSYSKTKSFRPLFLNFTAWRSSGIITGGLQPESLAVFTGICINKGFPEITN